MIGAPIETRALRVEHDARLVVAGAGDHSGDHLSCADWQGTSAPSSPGTITVPGSAATPSADVDVFGAVGVAEPDAAGHIASSPLTPTGEKSLRNSSDDYCLVFALAGVQMRG